MKLNGEKISGKNIEIVVIPRPNRQIVFKCQAVDETFDDKYPPPEPPIILKPGRVKESNPDDPNYKKAMEEWGEKKVAWLVLKSLEATEDLEWETINKDDINTWLNYKTELKESGFTNIEINHILNGVLIANCLNEAKLEKAREDFLRSMQQTTILN